MMNLERIMQRSLMLALACTGAATHGQDAAVLAVSSREQPVVAFSGDVPIYGYGKIFINGLCPDFETGVVVQEKNKYPKIKIQPKKSWELGENLVGITPEQAPRSQASEFQPFLPINLIDGRPESAWLSRGQAQPDVQPEWVRIDLARETPLREIVLAPLPDGQGIPATLSIRLSRDAWHWETVHETNGTTPTTHTQPLRIRLNPPRAAKQIWIIGDHLPFVLLPNAATSGKPPVAMVAPMHLEHRFGMTEVQVLDELGQNVALATRGAGVTVSSTYYGFHFAKELVDWLWPVHYDLGVKWLRVNHWDWATLQWSYVEREKGKYFIDPLTDQAMTETAKNGISIVMALCYGNWLYGPEPRPNQAGNIWNVPFDVPPLPVTPEALEGFENYVRYMVCHFKGRVKWYEIWNEPNGAPNYGFQNAKDYSRFVKAVVPVIRKSDPNAKILLGSIGVVDLTFIRECLDDGVGPLVDGLGWHPFYGQDPNAPEYVNYPNMVSEFKKYAQNKGFKGQYMATEWLWSAPYPFGTAWTPISEMQKAKNAARCLVMHRGLDIIPFWVDTWCDMTIQVDSGLFRNAFASAPLNQLAPQPVYYVYRTLCTVMEDAKATSLTLEFSNKTTRFDAYAFQLPGTRRMLAVWLPGQSRDIQPGIKTDIIIQDSGPNDNVGRIFGLDTLNGFEQILQFRREADRVVVPDIVVRDYPLILRLEYEN